MDTNLGLGSSTLTISSIINRLIVIVDGVAVGVRKIIAIVDVIASIDIT